jgi:predicted MFS family arabinose efflux permease
MVVIVLLTTTISLVSDLGWGAPVVWGGLLTAVALLPVLARIERRSAHPVIDLATLRHDGIGRLFLAGFFTGAARFPVTVLISLYLQAMLHLNPAEAGLHLLPLPLGSIMASMSVGWLSRRCSARTISLLGAVVGQVGVVLLTGAVMADLSWLLAPALAVGGAGTGLFIGSNATALLESTPPDSLGVVNAMRLMVQNTGNVVSLALALTVLTAGLPGALRDSLLQATVPDGSDGPIRAGFTVALLFLCVLGAVAIAFSVSSRAAVLRGPAPARASKTAWPESLRSPARTPKTPVSTDSSHN